MRYFFILGRNPELSLAEINAVLPNPFSIQEYGNNLVIAECQELNHQEIMKRLGGTIKMGEILPACHFDQVPPRRDGRRNLSQCVWQSVRSLDFARDDASRQKIFIGLSAYSLNEKIQLPDARQLRQLGIEIKHALKEQGCKVRIVTSKQPTLSAVTVQKEKLLRRGAEVVLIYDARRGSTSRDAEVEPLYIGHTLAVQEFEQASQRDYGRPARSMNVGMLPIQLAKIMINLARVPKSATILDPFCGLGTILSEASVMGYKKIIGSDIEQKMIDATRENLSWLKTHQKESFCDSAESQNTQLFESPVEELSKHLAPNSIDAIVTEPYLGPTSHGTWNIKHGTKELADLYIKAFEQFAKILKPNGRVVFVFPVFKQNSQLNKTSEKVLPEIKKLGFQPTPLLPNDLINQLTNHLINSLTYSRPDQKVLRELFVFEFKPRP